MFVYNYIDYPCVDVAMIDPVAFAIRWPEVTRERFHKVILGAGYGEQAAQSILAEWFDQYMTNFPEFIKMLEEYEKNQSERLDKQAQHVLW